MMFVWLIQFQALVEERKDFLLAMALNTKRILLISSSPITISISVRRSVFNDIIGRNKASTKTEKT